MNQLRPNRRKKSTAKKANAEDVNPSSAKLKQMASKFVGKTYRVDHPKKSASYTFGKSGFMLNDGGNATAAVWHVFRENEAITVNAKTNGVAWYVFSKDGKTCKRMWLLDLSKIDKPFDKGKRIGSR